MYKLSPALLTLLVFLLAQGVGAVLFLFIGMEPVSLFSLTLMAVNILAVLGCHFFLHNIQLKTTFNVSSIKWRPAFFAVIACILGAQSISILTDKVELPQSMLQISLAMSHDFCGVVALVLMGPLTEELLFREAIAGEMLRRGAKPWMAILVSALAFSTVHLNLAQGLYALPLGILLGIIYCKTHSIVLTSLFHIINNGFVVIQLHMLGESIADISYMEWFGGARIAYAVMLLFGILSIFLMKLFWEDYPFHQEERQTTGFADF